MASIVPLAGAGAVALLSFAVSGAGYRAMVRTGNPAIGFAVAAFLVLGVKSAWKAAFLLRGGGVPAGVEVLFTLADVAMVALVAWPLLGGRRR